MNSRNKFKIERIGENIGDNKIAKDKITKDKRIMKKSEDGILRGNVVFSVEKVWKCTEIILMKDFKGKFSMLLDQTR